MNGDARYVTTTLATVGQSLLLLVGDGGPEADSLVRSAVECCNKVGVHLDLHVVSRDTETAAARRALVHGDETLFLDPELDLHNRLGVVDRCAMWIRPDGRIGCRDDGGDTIEPTAAHMLAALPGLVGLA